MRGFKNVLPAILVALLLGLGTAFGGGVGQIQGVVQSMLGNASGRAALGVADASAVPSVWTSFTPTGSWVDNSTYTGKYRWVGPGIMEVHVAIETTGVPTDTALTLDPPSGWAIDPEGHVFSTGAATHSVEIGQMSADNDGGGRYGPGICYLASSAATAVSLMTTWNLGSDSAGVFMSQAIHRTSPFTWGDGDSFWARFTISVVAE